MVITKTITIVEIIRGFDTFLKLSLFRGILSELLSILIYMKLEILYLKNVNRI